MLKKLLGLLREWCGRVDKAGYTSVPPWRPWRDF